MRKIGVILFFSVVFFLIFWFTSVFFAIKDAKIAYPVKITIEGIREDDLKDINAFRITPRSHRQEPLVRINNTWSSSKYFNKILLLLSLDTLDKINVVRIQIGNQTYYFNHEEFKKGWEKIKKGKDYFYFISPHFVKNSSPTSIAQFKNIINWPGIFFSIKKSFNFNLVICALLLGVAVFLLSNYPSQIYNKGIIKILKRNNKARVCFIVFISLVIAFCILGENLRAKFWIIDDHEIMNFLGSGGKLTLNEILPKFFSNRETGVFGTSLFRLSYNFIKLLEICLWGENATLWYLARILIFAFFIIVLWYLFQKWIGLIYSFVFTMSVISYPYWVKIFYRLGPPEIYAILGLTLYFLGFFNYLGKVKIYALGEKNYCVIEWLCMIIGSLIAFGSKENSLIFILPTLYVFVDSLLKKRLNFVSLLSIIIITFYALLAVVSLYLGLSKAGVDAFLRDATFASKFSIFKEALLRKTSLLFISSILCLIAFFLIFYFLKRREYFKKNLKIILKTVLLPAFYISLLFFIYLVQIVFYAGGWPTRARYDFPGMLALDIFYLFLIFTLLNLMKFLGLSLRYFSAFKFFSSFVFIFIIIINCCNFNSRDYIKKQVLKTIVFSNNIEKIAKQCKENPEWPLIFKSFWIMDSEPVISVCRFLVPYQVKNPYFLEFVNSYPPELFSEKLQKIMIDWFYSLSQNGGEGGFRPLSELKIVDSRCFVVEFSGNSNSYSSCINLGKIYGPEEELSKAVFLEGRENE